MNKVFAMKDSLIKRWENITIGVVEKIAKVEPFILMVYVTAHVYLNLKKRNQRNLQLKIHVLDNILMEKKDATIQISVESQPSALNVSTIKILTTAEHLKKE